MAIGNCGLICGGDACDNPCPDNGYAVFGTGGLTVNTDSVDACPGTADRSFYSLRGGNAVSSAPIPLVFSYGESLAASGNGVVLTRGAYVFYTFQCVLTDIGNTVTVTPRIDGIAVCALPFIGVRSPSGLVPPVSGFFALPDSAGHVLSFTADAAPGAVLRSIAFDVMISPL